MVVVRRKFTTAPRTVGGCAWAHRSTTSCCANKARSTRVAAATAVCRVCGEFCTLPCAPRCAHPTHRRNTRSRYAHSTQRTTHATHATVVAIGLEVDTRSTAEGCSGGAAGLATAHGAYLREWTHNSAGTAVHRIKTRVGTGLCSRCICSRSITITSRGTARETWTAIKLTASVSAEL
jgi:hypothetical protein